MYKILNLAEGEDLLFYQVDRPWHENLELTPCATFTSIEEAEFSLTRYIRVRNCDPIIPFKLLRDSRN